MRRLGPQQQFAVTGTAAAPGWSFAGYAGTGTFGGSGFLAFAVEGAEVARLTSSVFQPATNAAVDLGAAALRFRNGYLSGLDVSPSASTFPPAPAGTVIRLSADGVTARFVFDTFGAAGNFIFRSSGGTAANPTALASGALIGQFTAFGYGATAYSTAARAAVQLLTAEAWTDTAQGTRILLRTTPVGAAAAATALTIEPNGSLYPGLDNGMDLGSASARFRNAYLVNNPTVSSDAALKTPRASPAGGPALTAAELAAWAKVSPSVWTLNGDASGLLHVGYIAQAVQAAFAAQGLDITKYALWRQDTMPDGSTRSALVYAECAVFEAAYQRQQVGLLTRQIAALAKLLNLTLPTL